MKVVNPVTEESSEFKEHSLAEIEEIFSRANVAFTNWKNAPIKVRLSRMAALAETMRARLERLAQTITAEMGKPISRSRVEVARAIEEIDFFVAHGEEYLAPVKSPDSSAQTAEVHFDPLGVVAVISPWNFPVMLPLRGIVSALIAGNTVIFKPSELTPRTGLEIFNHLQVALGEEKSAAQIFVGGKEHGEKLVAQPVSLICFTGSTAVGKRIAAEAAKSLKRLVLELGGLDAAIVLPDVDIEKTAKAIINANAMNSGQVCNALKRVYVHREIYQPFLAELVKQSQALQYGDPMQESTNLGPIVSKTQLERVERFVQDAVGKGATVSSGGKRITGRGYFYQHTVLTDINDSMDLLHEEPFGPVLPVMPIASWEEGVKAANNTRYGLTASVWTNDITLGETIASQLDVGIVSINSHSSGSPGTPWGGAKESGIGRMKTKEGLREFTNVKLVRIAK